MIKRKFVLLEWVLAYPPFYDRALFYFQIVGLECVIGNCYRVDLVVPALIDSGHLCSTSTDHLFWLLHSLDFFVFLVHDLVRWLTVCLFFVTCVGLFLNVNDLMNFILFVLLSNRRLNGWDYGSSLRLWFLVKMDRLVQEFDLGFGGDLESWYRFKESWIWLLMVHFKSLLIYLY